MFSFIKILDICEKNITLTFNGDYKNYKKILKQININYLVDSTIIHKENKNETFVIICKNQTCSNKLTTSIEIDNYLQKLN